MSARPPIRPASDNRARPGHPVILETLRRVARGGQGGDVRNRDTKLGLVVEGGGMRGVMSGGSLIAMERLGLTSAFDEVYAESAGAINACYFLGGEAAFGGRIYLEDLTSIRFMNPMRRGRLLDVDFLVDHVMSCVKPLPVARVIQARSRLFVSLTNVNDGTRRVVDIKKESVPLLTLLKATAAIIPLYNRSVVLEGVPYDVRYRRYNEARALAFGKVAPPPGVELAVICPASTTPMVTRTTISHRRLQAGMDDSIARTTALFQAGT